MTISLARIFQEDEREWVFLAGPAEKIKEIYAEYPDQLPLFFSTLERSTVPTTVPRRLEEARRSAFDYQIVRTEIEECVSSVLRESELNSEKISVPPIAVDQIAVRIFNLQIETTLREKGIIGKLIAEDKRILLRPQKTNTKVYIASGFSPRQRFTIAHEIGHFVLHIMKPTSNVSSCSKKNTSIIEREADIFAASLLMPKRLFYQHLFSVIDSYYPAADFGWLRLPLREVPEAELGVFNRFVFNQVLKDYSDINIRIKFLLGLVPDISKIFQVSKQAMSLRMKDFGLLGDIQK